MLKSKTTLKSKKPLTAHKPLQRALKPKVKKRLTLEQKSMSELLKLADYWFSRYVRLRDSELQNGSQWWGTCITCTKYGMIAYIDEKHHLRFNRGWDNGHFVSRGHFITRFEEENCNLQCAMRCNKMRSGEIVKYKAALKLKYGDEVPGSLEAMADDFPARTHNLTRQMLLEIIHDYRVQVEYYFNTAKE